MNLTWAVTFSFILGRKVEKCLKNVLCVVVQKSVRPLSQFWEHHQGHIVSAQLRIWKFNLPCNTEYFYKYLVTYAWYLICFWDVKKIYIIGK